MNGSLRQEQVTSSGVPWTALLNIVGRIPKLQDIAFLDLYWMPPPAQLPPSCADIFLDAPSLTVATFNAGSIALNLPWSQLTEINIDTSDFGTYREFANYFNTVMRRTTASSVGWGDTLEIVEDDGNIWPTLPTVKNPHVVELRLQAVILPPLLTPNLTSLRFIISDERDQLMNSVPRIVSLLRDSECRLENLTIDQCPAYYTGDINSFAPLLPYLSTLRSLTWNASLVKDAIMDKLLDGLRDLLDDTPTNLPKLNTLEVNIIESPQEGAVEYCLLDAQHASAVWDIVQARMMGHGTEATLATFHIDVIRSDEDPMIISRDLFDGSPAGQNIKAAGVDFRLYPEPESNRVT